MKIISFLSLIALLFLSGCVAVSPITWKERIDNKPYSASVDLHYQEKGQGDVMLLLHGFGESSFTWRYLFDDLAKSYRVIALDLKGFGDSPKPRDGRYSIYDQAVAVSQFIKKHDLKKVTLVGHSLGGGVAMALTLLANKQPWQVQRLIVIDAAAYQQTLPSMLKQLKDPVVGNIGVYLVSPRYQARKAYEFSFYDDEKIPEEGVEESARNFSRAGSRYVYLQSVKQLIPEDIKKISELYKEIKQPALIIWGFHDVVISRRYARRLHQDLKNSHLVLIRRVGHMPQEEAPEKVLKLINDFMAIKFP
jgi:pimeloyl-ACP methyl ester carboxylesterase